MEKKEEQGVYFVKTSLRETQNQEELVWNIYASIRNIESAFRCLKTDLDLCPVCHKTDDAGEAFLHLQLLAHRPVITILHKLKICGINSDQRETAPIMNTQKMAPASVENDENKTVILRKCSEPKEKSASIQNVSFRPKKIRSAKTAQSQK